MIKILRALKSVFLAIPRGLSITFRYLFRKPVTEQYPKEKPKFEDRYRGLHYLTRYDDGSERCVCCGLCAAAGPVDCIYMEPAETSDGIRYAEIYEINTLRCIYCGMCEEACPEEAIFLGHEFEFSSYDRDDFIFTKEMLLENYDKIEKYRVAKNIKPLTRKERHQFKTPAKPIGH
jgi:NADH-quinone oxidoreductase subunit I